MTSEAFPSAARVVPCLEKYDGSEVKEHSPFTMVFGAPFFEYKTKHPESMARFAQCMTEGNREGVIVKGFDWASLGKGLVVDVSK